MNRIARCACDVLQSRWSKTQGFMKKETGLNLIQYVGKGFYSSSLLENFFQGDSLLKSTLQCHLTKSILNCKNAPVRHIHNEKKGAQLSRDFFAKLWIADSKITKLSRNRRHKVLNSGGNGKQVLGRRAIFGLVERSLSGKSVLNGRNHHQLKLKQPPISQSVPWISQPASVEEAKVAPLLARSNLLITRDIEWANLVLGFEQENRYAIVDVCYPQSPVGFIREHSNVISRQLLRRRRPFIALITDGLGNELFRIRRPFWWITSSIYAEINGKEIGVVHQRWHLWRRIYNLYLGNEQFAIVENPGFWNWTFTLKDINGHILAEVDRDWRGFGFEIFTDAGQYVIRFGTTDPGVEADSGVQELNVTRSLTLSERTVAVALAVSLDNDYFSRHGGWGPLFVVDE